MKFNILFGGKAGQGPNILAEIVSEGLIAKGYYVFYSREYQSVIRGGHNYNILTFSESPVHSNVSGVDILVCLDDETEKIHKKNLTKKSIILKGNHENMYFAGMLFKLLGIEESILEQNLKKLKNLDQNLRDARQGYNSVKKSLNLVPSSKIKILHFDFMNGSQATAKSALISGLEYYYHYPMTPATPLAMELGQLQLDKNNKHKVIELENEISVMIAALGSSSVGAKVMIGTAGGGFDLMTEGLSMSGMAEIPIVIYLAARPGPSTGLATYTGQGDLNVALYGGHGEFSRVVIAPGDSLESEQAVNQAFYFSQKYRLPALILSDKHLAESKFVIPNNAEKQAQKMLLIPSAINPEKPERFNSYEHDEKTGVAIEDPKSIIKNFDRRGKKWLELVKEASKFDLCKIHGNKNSKNLIISCGSTKGAIYDAINESKLDAKFLQIIFMKPFPSKQVADEIKKAKKVLVVENNATGQLSDLITRKTGLFIEDKNKILRYDGRPFLSDELAEEIVGRL